MPRINGVFSPPAGTKGTPNTAIQSAPYNTFVDDLTADANAPRPVTAGGTGATTISGAQAALGLNDASNLTEGTLPDSILPGRLGVSARVTTDWNAATENGWWQAANTAANAPEAAFVLGHVERFSPNNITQTVHTLGDSEGDTRSYRREFNADTWTAWYRLRLSEAEQSALYLLKGEKAADSNLLDGQNSSYFQRALEIDGSIELGASLTGDRASYVDFHASDGVDYSARVIRNAGANGALLISNTGSGGINLAQRPTFGLETPWDTGNFNPANYLGVNATAEKASTLAANGGNGAAMTFNWSGQTGQPTWVWGSSDQATQELYNPGNFSVAFAANAGKLEAQDGAFYRNAGNLNAGTVPSARLAGTYTINITGNAGSLDGQATWGAGMNSIPVGGVGSYAMAQHPGALSVGQNVAGSSLNYSGVNSTGGFTAGGTLPGTWEVCGVTGAGSTASVFRRIA